ncbi:hypothetical protein AB205_0175840, partial [Aquarana catesbeiana]
ELTNYLYVLLVFYFLHQTLLFCLLHGITPHLPDMLHSSHSPPQTHSHGPLLQVRFVTTFFMPYQFITIRCLPYHSLVAPTYYCLLKDMPHTQRPLQPRNTVSSNLPLIKTFVTMQSCPSNQTFIETLAIPHSSRSLQPRRHSLRPLQSLTRRDPCNHAISSQQPDTH